jgi:glycosyltransferase involved in cell wall biosynthesis
MQRHTIGLVFFGNYKTWAGGVIYILNIVNALKTLPDAEMPLLYIYHLKDSPIEDVKTINYPHIEFFLIEKLPNMPLKILNYLTIKLFGTSIFFKKLPDVIYPYTNLIPVGKKQIHWIPDFQERYLPQFFTVEDIEARKKNQLKRGAKGNIVVFSSNDAKNDFERFYPDYQSELRLLRFATTLPTTDHLDINTLKDKYGIQGKYFFCPNQFWQHKNHIVLLEALSLLKKENHDFQVVLSGSSDDYRNKDYFQTLKTYIAEQNIENLLCFVGFIDREAQIKLMEAAEAIIQPSLFEGWSTVVEDAKAINQYLIVSNLKVHQEQLDRNALFFEPNDALTLSKHIYAVLQNPPIKQNFYYHHNITQFAKDIVTVLKY